MRKNEVLQKDVQDAIKLKPLLNAEETGIITKTGKRLKKIIYITSLAGIGLLLNSCFAGYVTTEPVYVEYARPARPSNVHIWINGDWAYNYHTHAYVQKTGYWVMPGQGRTYVSGQWQTTPRGKHWAPGRWQKQSRKR